MTFRKSARTTMHAHATGFTLLEVLVSVVIVAVAVLGSVGLQSFALRVNQGGQLRSQAVVLGLNYLERVEANNIAAVSGGYAVTTLPASASVDCASNFCTPDQLATYDLVQVKDMVAAQLPGGTVTVTRTGTGPFVYSIQINWAERITRTSKTTIDTAAGSAVQTGGKTESFSYTVGRAIYDKSLVI